MSRSLDLRGVLRRTWPAAPLLALLLLAALIGTLGSNTIERQITIMLVSVVIVVGFYTYSGTSGIMPFGHITFVLIGAYAAVLVTVPAVRKRFLLPDLPAWLGGLELGQVSGAIVCGLIAAMLAALLAIPISRLVGVSASLAMFAVLLAFNVVANNWDSVTRGTLGIFGVPQNTTIWVALAYALIAVCVALAFKESRLGLRLRASRDEEVAAQAVGVFIARDRAVALIVSGFLTGVGGYLYAQLLGGFSPSTFYLDLTFIMLAMLIIGGVNSVSGAVIGAVFVSVLQIVLRDVESAVERPGLTAVGLGLGMLAVLLFRPSGITNGSELPVPRFLRSGGRDEPRRPKRPQREEMVETPA